MTDRAQWLDRDELLARVSLPALLDSLTDDPPRQRGPSARWRCPDPTHPDRHPSVTVRVDHRGVERWRCWSGGHGGTAIDAVASAKRMPIGDAMRWLANRHADLGPVQRLPAQENRPVGHPDPAVLEYVERAAKLLWTPAGRPMRDWLFLRGLTEDTLRRNRVGADPGRRYLPRPNGFPAGWPGVVYPAHDPTGAVTYFQTRYLDPPAGRGKYDNPASRWARNPKLAWTIPPPSQAEGGALVVTEGVSDALTAVQAGAESVALLGVGQISTGSVGQIESEAARRGLRLVACLDEDAPGKLGTQRMAELLCGVATDPALKIPKGHDLTSLAIASPTEFDVLTRDWGSAAATTARRSTQRAAHESTKRPLPRLSIG